MQLTIIGTGTAVPDPQHIGSGSVIEHVATRVLIDCGPGVVHALARTIDWPAISHVGLTHFHNDHIGDLPFLFFAWKHGTRPARTRKLTLFGPPGLRALVNGLPDPLGEHIRRAAFDVDIVELQGGAGPDAGALRITSHPVPHTDTSLAYRIESADASIGLTGDTGPSDALGEFLHGVDALVAECSLPDDEAQPNHLSPASLATLAQAARPGVLILTHVYPQLGRAGLEDRIRAAGWQGRTVIAHDGMRLSLPA